MSVPADVVGAVRPSVSPARNNARRGAKLHALLVYGLCALLSFGPLAFGATEAWSTAVLEIGAAGLLLVWMLKQVSLGRVKLRAGPLYAPMAWFGAVVLFQLVAGATAYRSLTAARATLFLADAAILFLVAHTLRSDRDLKTFLTWFSIFGFAVAMFGILQGFTSPLGKLYWVRQPRFGSWTYGPYVDHSHFAGLMEMLIPLPLVMAVLGAERDSRRVLLWMCAAVMMASVFLSQSRGGVLAMLIALSFLAALTLHNRERRPHRSPFLLVAAAILFLVFVGWLGGESLLQRFSAPQRSDFTAPGRPVITRDTLRVILGKPVTGWGLGTYPIVFPHFRTFYTSLFVNHAHNDYLELIAETGVIGAFAIGWFLFALYRAAVAKLRLRQSRTSECVTLASLTACIGIVVHSFWDFNLLIPANAAIFFAMAALATARMATPRLHEASQDPRRSSVEEERQ